jgi:hypothetical protein
LIAPFPFRIREPIQPWLDLERLGFVAFGSEDAGDPDGR